MGCYSSSLADDGDKSSYSLKYNYENRQASKRSYFSQTSNGSSSGVSSACNSPSRPSVLSRCKSAPLSIKAKVRMRNLKTTKKNIPAASEMLTVCDDFNEAIKIQKHLENKSVGYYSESMSTDCSVSTPSQTCFRKPQDTSLRPKSPLIPLTPTPSDMEMEMYMMSRCQGLMAKTSSPIFQRRDVAYDTVAVASPASHSYQKWSKYLQSTPTYLLHNVTDIPEAVAGHFSPLDFPAFTDLEEMESAAKRFKADTHLANENTEDVILHQKKIPTPSKLPFTITTDL